MSGPRSASIRANAGAIAAALRAIGGVRDGKPTPFRAFGDPLRAVRHCVLTGQQVALLAQAIQELVKGDVDRFALEPGVEVPVEERIGTAVDEGHHRQAV
jgi:hypothetical protein